MKSNYDVIILGAGMAGLSMALSLSNKKYTANLRIAVLEKTAFESSQASSFDDRCIALSAGSKEIYQRIGIWEQLEHAKQADIATIVEAIKDIHISEQGQLGFARLNQQQEKVTALGYVVESQALGKILLAQVKQQATIDIFCPVVVKQLDILATGVSLQYQQQGVKLAHKLSTITASLLISADGSKSYAHRLLETEPRTKAYQQSAIIANIETQYPHQGQAFERFTPSGPLAILPLTKNRCSLVWTVKEKDTESQMALADADFLHQLQQHFGYRLGKIQRIGKRFSYPLILKNIDPHVASKIQRIIFVGNAAHSIHPVTGQGFNLGLRDIDCLSQLIQTNIKQHQGKFIYQHKLISEYWQNREKDIHQVSQFTDGLIRLFSNNTFPLTPVRHLSLSLFNLYQPLKSKLAHFAMGL